MEIADKIAALSSRVEKQKDTIISEEACKNAFIMPFLNALGYNVFNPEIVVPEFVADVGVKKGEKVDYAIKLEGQIVMLVECKGCSADLSQQYSSQLYRYFSVTDARFAVLTNGVEYWFYSDLDEKNKMDERPFFQFDILDYRPSQIAELNKFTKDNFDLDLILATASTLKYSSAVRKELLSELEDPSEDFVKLLASRVYDGRLSRGVREEFKTIVADAFREMIRELVNKRLTSALEVTSDPQPPAVEQPLEEENDIVTTDEEIEAYHIVKSIVRTVVSLDRIVMRDVKSYCSIILDDNNRKPIIRLHFNRSRKWISLFTNKEEDRQRIEELDDIYNFAERLRETVREYDGPESVAS